MTSNFFRDQKRRVNIYTPYNPNNPQPNPFGTDKSLIFKLEASKIDDFNTMINKALKFLCINKDKVSNYELEGLVVRDIRQWLMISRTLTGNRETEVLTQIINLGDGIESWYTDRYIDFLPESRDICNNSENLLFAGNAVGIAELAELKKTNPIIIGNKYPDVMNSTTTLAGDAKGYTGRGRNNPSTKYRDYEFRMCILDKNDDYTTISVYLQPIYHNTLCGYNIIDAINLDMVKYSKMEWSDYFEYMQGVSLQRISDGIYFRVCMEGFGGNERLCDVSRFVNECKSKEKETCISDINGKILSLFDVVCV